MYYVIPGRLIHSLTNGPRFLQFIVLRQAIVSSILKLTLERRTFHLHLISWVRLYEEKYQNRWRICHIEIKCNILISGGNAHWAFSIFWEWQIFEFISGLFVIHFEVIRIHAIPSSSIYFSGTFYLDNDCWWHLLNETFIHFWHESYTMYMQICYPSFF